jgi:transketolase
MITDRSDLPVVARGIRRAIIEMAHRSGSPHVGSCLSPVDIFTALYFGVLRLDPWGERDLFILSKGHAAMALYATLAARGIIPAEMLEGYYRDDGTLPAHLDRFTAKGIEVSAGSLGHGFSMALGMAHALRVAGSRRRVFALIGDGESQEGAIWEGAMLAPKLGLSNVTAIMDYNNLQGYGRPTELVSFEPVVAKWEAFGWQAVTADGHDLSLLPTLLREESDRPRMIIARTVKGKGVSFMEDQLIWHYYIVTDEHRRKAIEELA